MPILFSIFLLLLACAPDPLTSTSTSTSTTDNRRTLHQPFFPLDSQPPSQPPSPQSPTPKVPFSTSTPNQQPFFPSFPSPPPPPSPPSPSTFASFPANISSLTVPQTAKSKPNSKLVSVAVALVISAVLVAAIAIFLYIRRRRQRGFSDDKTYTSENSSRLFQANSRGNTSNENPRPRRSPPNSSEFLYLGTLVNSCGDIDARVAPSSGEGGGRQVNSRKLDSPELHPLPPLSGQHLLQNYGNADAGSGGDEEDEEFYSPRGSSAGLDSSIGTGSASRRAFAGVEVENLERRSSESSSSYSSSNSGSPARSVSISISPPVSSSPRSSRPKSSELVAVQAVAPPPPPPTPPVMTLLANNKNSPFPSPPSLSSPERALEKSQDSSPIISHVSDQNVESPARISRALESSQHSSPRISNVSDQNVESSARISRALERSQHSSPRISNVSDRNVESPARIDRALERSQHSSPRISNVSDQDVNSPAITSRGRVLEKSQDSSPRISNVSDQNAKSPARINGNIQRPVPVSAPPPPPPLPPPRHWESPVSTPSICKPILKPPVLITPSRPVPIQTPTSISPIELPPSCGTVEKNEETPKPKLKPLHWDKVRASSDREMVWDQLKSSSFKLNEEMIETLFVVNMPNSNPKEPTRRPVLPSPNQENRVLDPKKSQNIAISLRALNVTIEEVCDALLEGNADTLGAELLECLLKMAPTKEEERKLKEYKDDSPFKLGPAERFLKAVLDIPYAFKRVDAMLYMANFDSEVEYLKKSFETLEAACEELRSCRMFLKLLEAVLKTGNRMNVGTNRGDAHAFKLDTLLKLADVKGADGKTTLLHFVVQEIIRSEGARISGANQNPNSTYIDDAKCRKVGLQVVSGLSSELTNVKKACCHGFRCA
ncbi:hypothetical protein F0562_021662 [Nyssa sinensis]|uniref:Formin-like protein n=1 Tax=Nyssa sinensis TaxID=561372 RepID=A0A5J5BPE6_9ASTE|nr:hypothetical protein F0562_021662 [Nyssa sinensis]